MGELFTEVNGIKICYQIHGDGFPLVLLHGFNMYKEFWIAQVQSLLDKFKIITLDNRGCGKSDHPIEPYYMETMAEDVKSLLDFLEIKKINLGGHSVGGTIAQHFALKYPNRLNKLILMATWANLPLDKSGLEMYKENQLSNYQAKLSDPTKAFYDKIKLRFTRNFYRQMVEAPKKKFYDLFSSEDLKDFENNFGTSKPEDILNQIEAIAKHNTLEQLKDIQTETLILAGHKDKITPKIGSEVLHEKIPNSYLKIFNGGHWFPLENAPELNNAITSFLT
ncbi:MAG: alpha/beta fold hydrolase [Promethearchaeota archaeon]